MNQNELKYIVVSFNIHPQKILNIVNFALKAL